MKIKDVMEFTDYANRMYTLMSAFINAGFTRDEALKLVMNIVMNK